MDLFSQYYNRVKGYTHLKSVPDSVLKEYIPVEHYNYYWEKLGLDPDSTSGLRKRFDRAFNKFQRGTIDRSTFETRFNRIGQEISNLIEVEPVEDEIVEYQREPTLENNGDFEIELPGESIELQPLLEPTVDALAATAGVGETTASVGSTATALGGLGVGIIGATAGAAIYNKVTSSGATVPGTKYIGPGNPIDNGEPVSAADEDAREHDIAYSKGGDVSKADRDTINKFGDHFADNHLDIPALVGHIGLSVKEAVEKKTGQIYPSLKGNASTKTQNKTKCKFSSRFRCELGEHQQWPTHLYMGKLEFYAR